MTLHRCHCRTYLPVVTRVASAAISSGAGLSNSVHRFSARVESEKMPLLRGFLPPPRNETLVHWRKFKAISTARDQRVDSHGRDDVVAGLQVQGRSRHT